MSTAAEKLASPRTWEHWIGGQLTPSDSGQHLDDLNPDDDSVYARLAAGTTNVMVPILIIYTLEMRLERTAMVQVFNLTFLGGKLAQIGVFGAAGLLDAGVVSRGQRISRGVERDAKR